MNTHALLPIFALMGNVALWAGVYWQARRTALNRSYMFLCATIGLILVGEILLYVDALEGLEMLNFRGFTLVWVPIGAIFLNFVYRLLRRPPDWILYLAFVSSVLGAGIAAFTDLAIRDFERYSWGVGDMAGPLHIPIVVLSSIWATTGIVLVAHRAILTSDRSQRGTLAILLIGAVGSNLSACSFEMIIPDILGIGDFPRHAGAALTVFNLFVFIAYKRYDFLSMTPEQMAEDLFHGSSEGMVLVGCDGKVQRMNPTARFLLHVPLEENGTKQLAALIDPATLESGVERHEVLVGSGENKRTLHLSASTPTHAGKDVGRIVLIRDVTESKRAEALLLRSNEELERTVEQRTNQLRQAQKMQAVGTLAGGIAHDFNSYLAAIIGFATAGRSDLPEDSPVRDDFDEVLDATEKAGALTKQILTFARQSDTAHDPVDMTDIICGATKLVEVSLHPDTKLESRIDDGKMTVSGETSQLGQVVINLCTNASHAMGERPGKIRVELRRVEVDEELAQNYPRLHPGPYVQFSVIDDGEGMTPEVLERVFEPYFTTKPAGSGTGLGLSTVFGIVESHEGEILFESEPGRGTEVKVYLPALERDEEQHGNATLTANTGTLPKGARILVVDDDAQVLRMICRLLDSSGCVTSPYDNPNEALSTFDKAPDEFDAVVTDLMMPGMSGIDLSSALLERRPKLPIVIVSGRNDMFAGISPQEMGVAALLPKPVTRAALLSAISEGIDG